MSSLAVFHKFFTSLMCTPSSTVVYFLCWYACLLLINFAQPRCLAPISVFLHVLLYGFFNCCILDKLICYTWNIFLCLRNQLLTGLLYMFSSAPCRKAYIPSRYRCRSKQIFGDAKDFYPNFPKLAYEVSTVFLM